MAKFVVSLSQHSAKHVSRQKKQKKYFVVCHVPTWEGHDTRQKRPPLPYVPHVRHTTNLELCRVLWFIHSVNHIPRFLDIASLPSVIALRLGNEAVCRVLHTTNPVQPTFFCFFTSYQSNKKYINICHNISHHSTNIATFHTYITIYHTNITYVT